MVARLFYQALGIFQGALTLLKEIAGIQQLKKSPKTFFKQRTCYFAIAA